MSRTSRCFLLFVALAFLAGCGPVLNTGAYAKNYIILEGSNADFLIHPTGQYPSKTPVRYRDVGYHPNYRDVDNMEQAIMEMQEKGYVMIGYSAVNTRERPEMPCDPRALSDQELNNCRLAYMLRTGLSYDEDTLGTPIEAAMWANADTVLVQRNYSFSRVEVQQRRIIADEGTDIARSSGVARGAHHENWSSSTYGMSQTKGESATTGSFDQQGREAHADIGGSGAFGPSGNIGGSLSGLEGRHQSNTQYGEKSNFQSSTGGESQGRSMHAFDNVDQRYSKHWATALVEKNVDHYDNMVTFWKKARVDKMVLGALTDPTPRDLWQALGTRTARYVRAVIGDTPAYLAEIWEGDILIAINGEKIMGEAGYGKLLEKYQGKKVTITLWRNGEFYDVIVELNRRT